MDATNWRPTQGSGPPSAGEGDWRAKLQPEARSRIVNKIMETLKNCLPGSGPEELEALLKLAARFEERTYTAATDLSKYVRTISLKMISIEMKTQRAPGNAQVIPNQNSPGQGKTIQGKRCKRTTDVLEEKYNSLPLVSHEETFTEQVLRASRLNSPTPGLGDGDYDRDIDEKYKLLEAPQVKKAKISKGRDEGKTKKGKDVAIDNLVAVKQEEPEPYKDVKTE